MFVFVLRSHREVSGLGTVKSVIGKCDHVWPDLQGHVIRCLSCFLRCFWIFYQRLMTLERIFGSVPAIICGRSGFTGEALYSSVFA